ncbi:MAG: PDZ domain-containing protein [Vicinamibacterales bacterium]
MKRLGRMSSLAAMSAIALMLAVSAANAQVSARMFRQPDVSATQIAFVYAGDIWLAPRTGGMAVRLSSPRGEESFPRFSPDGARLAFSANYDGNVDVYVAPSVGGEPVRLTSHPMEDRLVDWHPDGKRVLVASSRESGRQRYSQFYLVDATTGGLPEKLIVPYGEFGAFSVDGRQFAYMPQSQDFRTWKRYRGGWAPDIWVFDLKTVTAKNITMNDANDAHPMWHGDTLYFMSDRGTSQRTNLWAYDRRTGRSRQVTDFGDFDITFPAIGPKDIVFQAGGRLYLMDLATEKVSEVDVRITTDLATLRTRIEKTAALIQNASISPTGKRATFEARGDVYSLPAEHGPVVNLTRSSGVAERYPRWSPDGKTIAYWTDRSGEYELALRPADGSGGEQMVTKLGPGFRYTPAWAPNSRKLAFVDQAMKVRIHDLEKNQTVEVDQSPAWLSHGALVGFTFQWSSDSRWLAFSRPVESTNNAIFLYDTRNARLHQVTTGYFADTQPAFDPDGKFLFYTSNRSFEPVYSDFDNSWAYPNSTRIVAVTLRRDVESPLAERNDTEGGQKAGEKEPEKKEPEKKDAAAKAAEGKAQEGQKPQEKAGEAQSKVKPQEKEAAPEATEPGESAPVEIDLDGFEARAVVLPPKAGNYQGLHAVKGKVLYRRLPRTGSGDDKSPVMYYDLAERAEKTILADADGFEVSADGKKLLAVNARQFHILDIKPDQKLEKPLRTAEMEGPVDPRAEWRQMFADAYRFERDYFYDQAMHGVDWKRMREQYGRLIEDAVTRWDVNFVLGEFIAELNASHTYRGGGDQEQASSRGVGMLGVDWEVTNGAYRVKHIVSGGPWDIEVRSPLAEPGVNVEEGDYVLAVNGVPLEIGRDPWFAFQGLANQPVTLTVNGKPTSEGSRQVVVKCMADETELRFREWIEQRRNRVEGATGGKAGYIYVQSTGVDAQNELVRQFMAQWSKDGLVIDERFNSGGQIPDRFIELLNRPALSYWASRDGETQQWPPVAHRGAKAMLINGWSGSGGDAFPFYFREAKLGPLVGTRTWGGLIGISGVPPLVDGGSVTVPTFRMYDVNGKWFAEGHGVEPDIRVDEDPAQLAKGIDPQLEKAIEEVEHRMAAQPAKPARPAPERRVPIRTSPSAAVK